MTAGGSSGTIAMASSSGLVNRHQLPSYGTPIVWHNGGVLGHYNVLAAATTATLLPSRSWLLLLCYPPTSLAYLWLCWTAFPTCRERPGPRLDGG